MRVRQGKELAASTLKAVSDLAAWSAVMGLNKHKLPPEGAMNVEEIVAEMGMCKTTAKDRLKLAIEAGFVETGEFYHNHTVKNYYWLTQKAKDLGIEKVVGKRRG